MSIKKIKKPEIKRILAVDFGKSKVGLAFSEVETKIAFCLGVLLFSKNILKEIERIIKEKRIDTVVVGKTQWFDRKEDEEYQEMVYFFKNDLKKRVEFAEEMFSSKMAQENLKKIPRKKISQDDAEAARIILQDWLDKKLEKDEL